MASIFNVYLVLLKFYCFYQYSLGKSTSKSIFEKLCASLFNGKIHVLLNKMTFDSESSIETTFYILYIPNSRQRSSISVIPMANSLKRLCLEIFPCSVILLSIFSSNASLSDNRSDMSSLSWPIIDRRPCRRSSRVPTVIRRSSSLCTLFLMSSPYLSFISNWFCSR